MREIRCPACQRLLCKASGVGTVIELKCRGGVCNATVVVDALGRVSVTGAPAPRMIRAS